MESSNKLRILSIGSNSISAFLAWRLQASGAADVTLVWRSHFDSVNQFGVGFKSDLYTSERFRPFRVVRTVEEASDTAGYDYVFVCVKALPDVYDLAQVITSVITPAHTCIVLNTTTCLGVEASIQSTFPRNLVISLCSAVELIQTGPADFEHVGSRTIRIGAVKSNPNLPQEAQQDMTESLTLTLEAGAVDCIMTGAIEKHQWERLIGAMAFHPVSVILQEPSHEVLMENTQVALLIEDVLDECLQVAEKRRCNFAFDFKQQVIKSLTQTKEPKSTMYQDFLARRPLEIEVLLATPIRMAKEANVPTPKLESIYALLSMVNKVNQSKVNVAPAGNGSPAHALVPQHTGQSMMGQQRMMYRQPGPPDAAMVRQYGPPPTGMNGYRNGPQPMRRPSQQGPPPTQQPRMARQESIEDFGEFASVAMYSDMPDPAESGYDAYGVPLPPQQQSRRAMTGQPARPASNGTFTQMGKKMGKMRLSRGQRQDYMEDEDDDDDDFAPQGHAKQRPAIHADQVDMLAMTRRPGNNRSSSATYRDDGYGVPAARPKMNKTRSTMSPGMADIPNARDVLTSSALFGMGDNRYGIVDSQSLVKQGRTMSMQSSSQRLNSLGSSSMYAGGGGGNHHYPRPQGPPNSMMNGRNGYPQQNGNGRGYNAPQNLRGGPQPQQAYPQPRGQQYGYPAKGSDPNLPASVNPAMRSVTGSASASFGSAGENASGSHSSSSSLDRPANGNHPQHGHQLVR
ncbi:ketopantoate reductase PanE/ApbA C terminal-domain-containing protein [Protomyces lactucae-debilis]|uniref:Ketopantoate reductase PanE/ApbA C terminal-domain-containing protein n=1 Tax=Protomyces lactucae-debilis TaxID=2754530 RepID=A0A1Y2FSH2_PROLT|nr:ketopantoate reductase PanE/ApbA C terminal-domain-containing protein [Protomyces lactucae-debilis]ORY86951.1 ketopantoate reductase PanE/ApbA C terminal-domain-containing protein [Protomyces lactucae-debilis]